MPTVIRINSHKSIWLGFNYFCHSINRDYKYVMINLEKK